MLALLARGKSSEKHPIKYKTFPPKEIGRLKAIQGTGLDLGLGK